MSGRHSRAALNRQAALDGPARPQRWHGSSVFTQVTVLTLRAVLEYVRDPRRVVGSVMQPVLGLYLLTGIFSKIATHVPGFPHGVSYFDYVLPAALVTNALDTSLSTGTGLIDELKSGIVARLRSLPILPSSLLTARSLTGMIRTAFQALILLTLAQLTHGSIYRAGPAALPVSLGLTLLIGWSLGWAFLAASVWLRRAETMQNLGFTALFLLTFSSSAYVPVTALPTWLSVVAHLNPLTYAINATRSILLQTPGGSGAILPAVLTSLVIAAAGAFAAVLGFRRPLEATQR